MKCIPKKYKRGTVCNDVDVCRRQKQFEKVDIPARYTTSVGTKNSWNNSLVKSKGTSGAVKKKTFDISGQICITESTEGCDKAKTFTAVD